MEVDVVWDLGSSNRGNTKISVQQHGHMHKSGFPDCRLESIDVGVGKVTFVNDAEVGSLDVLSAYDMRGVRMFGAATGRGVMYGELILFFKVVASLKLVKWLSHRS